MPVNTSSSTNKPALWLRLLVTVGSVAMLAGALDPLEGSIAIWVGSGLVTLGTFLGRDERRLIVYRTSVFGLITFGVGAMWVLSSLGGFGGKSGLSMWWGMLIVPYLVGWAMAVCGPGFPRWFWMLGIGVGLWYLAILTIIVTRSGLQKAGPALVLGVLGAVVIAGGVYRLISRPALSR